MKDLSLPGITVVPSYRVNGLTFLHGQVAEALMLELSPLDYEALAKLLCKMENFVGKVAEWLYAFFKRLRRAYAYIKKPVEARELSRVDDLAKQPSIKAVLGVGVDEWLVMGHTHNPYVDFEAKVANCGNWVKETPTSCSRTAYSP